MGKKTTLISLDCSTKRTGMAIWENGKYKTSHVIDCSKIKDVDERIWEMGKLLWKGLEYYSSASSLATIYVEDTYCHGNPDVQKKLDRIQGIVLAWCIQHDASFNYVMPSAWRKYIPEFPNGRSKREEQKAFSMQYVADHYKIDLISDDQADAILIGEAVIRMSKEDTLQE